MTGVPPAALPAVARPRVVMLVADGVLEDSRVQKTAGAAAAEWDVVLLGVAADGRRREFRLDLAGQPTGGPDGASGDECGARVVLLPVPAVIRAGGRGAREATRTLRRWDAIAAADRRAGGARGPLRRVVAAVLTGALARRPLPPGLRRVLGAPAAFADPTGGWRYLNLAVRDLELAFGAELDTLGPELIHAHDYHTIGIAAAAAARLSGPRGVVRWVYDAHEYVAGTHVAAPWDLRGRLRRRLRIGLEREFISRADAVVTVSDEIADRLQRDHRLARRPEVVRNLPPRRSAARRPERRLRADADVPPGAPVLVYTGGCAPQRGVETLVDALPLLRGVVAVLVVSDQDRYVPALLERAVRRGCADRLRVVPYVPAADVPAYLADATAGVIPILHRPNHELSLITKYGEYLHAGLPILVSDVRTMAATTRRLGNGIVFRAGDPVSLAAAAALLLADPDRYTGVYRRDPALLDQLSWERQAATLRALYARLRGCPGGASSDGASALYDSKRQR